LTFNFSQRFSRFSINVGERAFVEAMLGVVAYRSAGLFRGLKVHDVNLLLGIAELVLESGQLIAVQGLDPV